MLRMQVAEDLIVIGYPLPIAAFEKWEDGWIPHSVSPGLTMCIIMVNGVVVAGALSWLRCAMPGGVFPVSVEREKRPG